MADKYPWIKLSTEFTNDEKINFIINLDNGYQIAFAWIGLLCEARKNDGIVAIDTGKIYIPYSIKVLSKILGVSIEILKKALGIFRDTGMIEFHPEGIFEIKNWAKHQYSESTIRVRKHRKKNKEKKVTEASDNKKPKSNKEKEEYKKNNTDKKYNVCENVNSTGIKLKERKEKHSSNVLVTHRRKNLESEKEKEKEGSKSNLLLVLNYLKKSIKNIDASFSPSSVWEEKNLKYLKRIMFVNKSKPRPPNEITGVLKWLLSDDGDDFIAKKVFGNQIPAMMLEKYYGECMTGIKMLGQKGKRYLMPDSFDELKIIFINDYGECEYNEILNAIAKKIINEFDTSNILEGDIEFYKKDDADVYYKTLFWQGVKNSLNDRLFNRR